MTLHPFSCAPYLLWMQDLMSKRFQAAVQDIVDFPKPGVTFKDLGGVWRDPELCRDVISVLVEAASGLNVEAVVGIESRGFLLGMPLAMALGVPFVPVRKAGKLPGSVLQQSYALEYGEATIEVQTSAIQPGLRCLVHDDVLATGGTASACAALIEAAGGQVVGWSFLIELAFLNPRSCLPKGPSYLPPFMSVA